MNHNSLKRLNRSIILNKIFEKQPVSRKDVALQTGLTPGVVSRFVGELISCGIVREIGVDTSQKRSGGPNPILLSINSGAPYIISINIGVKILMISLVNLQAKIIDNEFHQIEENWEFESLITNIKKSMKNIESKQNINISRDVLAIGVSIGGIVHSENGIIVWHNLKSLRNYPIKTFLEQNLGLPVFIDNIVQAMALAEAWFGKGKDVDKFAFVYVGSIVGSAIVIDGKILNGKRNLVGQIGHNIIDINGPVCSCGHNGCLEIFTSSLALVKEAKNLFISGENSLLKNYIESSEQITIDLIVKAADAGDSECLQMLVRRGEHLGKAIAGIVNLFDPSLVILALEGNFSESEFKIINRVYKEHVIYPDSSPAVIKRDHNIGESLIIAAASLAIQQVFSPKLSIEENINDEVTVSLRK